MCIAVGQPLFLPQAGAVTQALNWMLPAAAPQRRVDCRFVCQFYRKDKVWSWLYLAAAELLEIAQAGKRHD